MFNNLFGSQRKMTENMHITILAANDVGLITANIDNHVLYGDENKVPLLQQGKIPINMGSGESCFHPDELIFIDRGKGVECMSFENVFSLVETEENIKILSGDINGLRFETLEQASVRIYEDDLIEILFTLGKKIKVTKDHPIPVYQNGKLTVKLAETLEKNDRVILPFGQFSQEDIEFDLLDELKQSPLVEKVWLNNPSFVNNEFEKIKNSISLKHPQDIKRTGTVKVKDILEYKSLLDAQYSNSVIFTSISQPNAIPYKFKLDGEFARLIGYYLAAGWIIDKRLYVSFGAQEAEYIEDAKCILKKLGIKFIERLDNNKLIFIVSSYLFSYFFEKVLHCGLDAYTKTIPTHIFRSPAEIKLEFLKGLFRGNGASPEAHQWQTGHPDDMRRRRPWHCHGG